MNKGECESMGGEWVESYRKEDGTHVKSFCRRNNHNKIDKKNMENKALIKRQNKKFAESLVYDYLPDVNVKWLDNEQFFNKADKNDDIIQPENHKIFMNKRWLNYENHDQKAVFHSAVAGLISEYQTKQKYGKEWYLNKEAQNYNTEKFNNIIKTEKYLKL